LYLYSCRKLIAQHLKLKFIIAQKRRIILNLVNPGVSPALATKPKLSMTNRAGESPHEKGLSVTGTLGIIIEARERGMIPSVRCELDRLIEAGMWIDEAFYHRILQEFGE